MENRIYDHANGLWYEKQGDYYYPCVPLSEDQPVAIGKWGLQYLDYIKKHSPVFYLSLSSNDRLNTYLAEIDRRAKNMRRTLLEKYQEKYNINDELKTKNPFEWIRQMNSISHMADEAVLDEIIWRDK